MEQELETGGESKGIYCNIKGSLEAYFELSMYESVPSDNRTLFPHSVSKRDNANSTD